MPKYGTEVKLKSDILDFKSDILFFLADLSLWNFFQQKKKDITKKKGYHSIYLSIFWAKTPVLYQAKDFRKRRKTVLKKKYSFEMNIFKIGSHYSRVFLKKNTFVCFFAKNMQKKLYTLGNSEKKNWSGTTFLLKMSKKPRR